MKWSGHRGLRFVQILNDEGKRCRMSAGLLEVLRKTFKSQQNETIMSL